MIYHIPQHFFRIDYIIILVPFTKLHVHPDNFFNHTG